MEKLIKAVITTLEERLSDDKSSLASSPANPYIKAHLEGSVEATEHALRLLKIVTGSI